LALRNRKNASLSVPVTQYASDINNKSQKPTHRTYNELQLMSARTIYIDPSFHAFFTCRAYFDAAFLHLAHTLFTCVHVRTCPRMRGCEQQAHICCRLVVEPATALLCGGFGGEVRMDLIAVALAA